MNLVLEYFVVPCTFVPEVWPEVRKTKFNTDRFTTTAGHWPQTGSDQLDT